MRLAKTARRPASLVVKASVIIAAHNAEGFLESAIGSALGQTLGNLEVIVTDDGSSDGTAGIIEAMGRRDGRVRGLRHPKALGPGAARNTAIREARGDWLAVLDADDAFLPNRLETMIGHADKDGLDVVADNLRLIDFETGKYLGLAFPESWLSTQEPISINYLLQRDWPGRHDGRGLGFLKPVIRRSALLRHGVFYEEDVRAGEDLLLLASMIYASAAIRLIPDALYVYSVRPGSVSTFRSATRHLVEANRRMQRRFRPEHGVRPDFVERGRAWEYQALIGNLKERSLAAAAANAARLPPHYVAQRWTLAFMRRLKPLLPVSVACP